MYNLMRVQKRNGDYEDVSIDKILKRIQSLCIGYEFIKKLSIDPRIIAQKVTLSIQITVIECECMDFSCFDLNVSCQK